MRADTRQNILISDISIGERLRPLDGEYVDQLASSIKSSWLRQPIDVRAMPGDETGHRWLLVSGAHRLEACRRLGMTNIPAVICRANDDEARLAEIDENLERRSLSPLDLGAVLWERKTLFERLYPASKRGGDRKSVEFRRKNQSDNVSLRSFTKATSERFGLDKRTIFRSIRIGRCLTPEVRSRLVGTSYATNQAELLALASLGPQEQRHVVDLLLDGAAAVRSVREAIAATRGRPKPLPDPHTKLWTAWRHTSADERSLFLSYLRWEVGREAWIALLDLPDEECPAKVKKRVQKRV